MGILKGLKVLDFSTLLPGPFATLMLADMGVDVIHVESPTRADMVRTMEPVDEEGISAAHRHLNRSKKSLALDLKNPESIDVIHSLLQEYDIVIEQFRPGVMTRLGLDYESLKKINPRIIYCSITGYGQTGPFANRAGHDSNYLSVAGVMDYSRRKGERPPVLGVQVADIAGGSLHSVVGILAAVYHREKTGEGQFIDISMTDASFSLNALYGSGYLAHGVEPQPENLTLNGGEFYDYYETKDGRFFSVGSLEPPFRKMLCESLGAVELIGIAFSEKQEDKVKFKEEVATRFLTKDFHEWLEIFNDEFDGCVEPVLTFAEATEHPQIKAREMIVEVPNENGTMQKQIAFPIKFSTNPAVYRQSGGQVGENNEAILREYGYLKSINK
jgi:alpha-methylacyl-CoA racemase